LVIPDDGFCGCFNHYDPLYPETKKKIALWWIDDHGQELVKEIQNHVKTTTAPYKYPRKIEFVEELPKTISGKIRRVDLRNREWGRENK